MYRDTRPEIVGRASELELVRRFLASTEQGTRALVLHGEAGIGKTVLWQHAASEAARGGQRVVATRPTEAEARLPFAGLNDLFGDLLDDVQPALAGPQRAALDVALLRAESSGPGPEPLAISLGLLGLIRAAVEGAGAGLTIAVDDIQWLDGSSAAVLEFVLRRLDPEPVTLLAAARTAAAARDPRALPVVRALPRDGLHLLEVAALSKGEVDRLIAATLGLDLPPRATRRIHEVSGGNPFYAIELARALQRHGATATTGDDLPLPDTLAALVRERLAGLSAEARQVAGYAAALATPDRATLVAALGQEIAAAGLGEAATAGVLLDGEETRFSHPLLAAEAYRGLGESERREMHRRLSAVAAEPEEQARHLASATEGADEQVADLLEAAAARAYGRGAPDDAADLAERAAVVTPDDRGAVHRRVLAAARYRVRAGEASRAREILETALSDERDAPRRAALMVLLAHVRQLLDDWGAAGEIAREALLLVGTDVRLEIEARLQLAAVSFITGREREAGARHMDEAMRLADELGDPRVLAGTIGHYARWRYVTGHPPDAQLERRAAELGHWTDHLRTMDLPDFDFAGIRWSEGDVDGYVQIAERLAERAEQAGDYSSLPFILASLGAADASAGRPDLARARLDQAERLARVSGQATALAHVLTSRTFVAARLGDAEAAWGAGRKAIELMDATGWRPAGRQPAPEALAELELARREFGRADELLQPVFERDAATAESISADTAALRVEALVGLGRLDEARAVLERHIPLRPDERPTPPRVASLAAHALVAGAAGDVVLANELIGEAQAVAERLGDRWPLARASLIAAEIHRRVRRRAAARDALARAIELFDAMGAKLWAANARDQLDRLAAARDAAIGLTPTQLEVAELAAGGLTNRQVADRLFMSPHTVEAHLSAVYRILGIRSRGELWRALRDAGDAARDSDGDSRDSGRHGPAEVKGSAEFR